MHYEPLPFKMRKRLPNTASAAFRRRRMLVILRGGRRSSFIHWEAKAPLCLSTTSAGRQGVQAVLAV